MMEFFKQSTASALQTSSGNGPGKGTEETDVKPLNIQELKSDHSQLWGSVPLSSARDGSTKGPAEDEQEEIPVYSFDFGSIKEEERPNTAEPAPPSKPEEDVELLTAQEDEGFTLKGGRKRKARDDADLELPSEVEAGSDAEVDQRSPATDEPEAPTPDADSSGDNARAIERALKQAKKQAKKARRAEFKQAEREAKRLVEQGDAEGARKLMLEAREARKAANRAAKLELQRLQLQLQQQQDQSTPSAVSPPSGAELTPEEQEQEQEQEDEDEQQPFDYSKAASVLHAASSSKEDDGEDNGNGNDNGKGKRAGGKAAFDPYSKMSEDAPQGARKVNYQRAGRTATFRK
jgi:exosome complex exonuclease RRP6